jgi:hypothetical protein
MLIDGDAFGDQLYFGMMVSTLKRLFLGLRPFWATGPGALRLSAVEHAPRHLLRAAPAIMRGRPNRFVRPDLGYVSHNARDIRLELDSGFTLDGELFESSEWDVTLGAGPEAFFLRLSR